MIERERERERERDKKDRENPNIPPQQPQNPKQPDPNSPSPKLPDSPSDKKDPSDNSHQELEEIKQKIKSTHKLTAEEYNAIVAPLNDKEILEYVSFLLGKVKEIQAGKDINTDSSEEYLLSYREATNSAKKRAYEAVNNYQQQVDKIITDLQNKKQVIKASLQELVSAESEEKLNQIYEKIKSEKEVYKDNNQKIIDNHHQRIHTAIKLEIKPEISEIEKQLASKLRVIINTETEKNVLQKLSQELSEFKSAKAGEKKLIYKNYNQTIDLMLGEIKSELNRREHSQKEQEKKPPRKQKNVSEKQKGSISVPVIISGVGLFLVLGSLLVIAWRRKRKLKLLKRKKIKK
ncbi:MAG: hypothetical protein I3273_07485 [Candidatus Moeniiplasma glomeromycotorum]|nr:hypothetical protein [Candidatus Moeniiplasma glomeromycotorum]MCE8169929.1 hypothetical protein [Candidatus Moeniiplasma glomeromycotorum]